MNYNEKCFSDLSEFHDISNTGIRLKELGQVANVAFRDAESAKMGNIAGDEARSDGEFLIASEKLCIKKRSLLKLIYY